MELYICSTYYHVYITLLKKLPTAPNTDLVICDDIPRGKELSDRISNEGVFRNVWFIAQRTFPDVRGKSTLDWILFQHRRRGRIIAALLPFDVHAYDDIYIYHDGTALGMFLNDIRKPYHMIEDALNFYQRVRDTAQGELLKPHNLKYYIRRALNSGYFPLGESRYVLDIEVNENRDIQIEGKDIIECPRKLLENQLGDVEKKLLMRIFNIEVPSIMIKPTALVLTEPLAEDGVCRSWEKQHKIYKDITTDLKQKGLRVVIKPHPRDNGGYADLGDIVLEQYFPIELLQFFPKKDYFDYVVTVTSSSLFSVKNAKRYCIWYGDRLTEITSFDDMRLKTQTRSF